MPTKSERAQLAGQIWAMDERRLRSLLASIPSEIHASPGEMAVAIAMRKTKDGASYSISNNVATIPIKGVILKSVPWYFEWLGIDAVSTDALTEQIRSAANDPDVHGIRFDVDSPGGTVDGVQELAATIRSGSAVKPTSASVSNLCASAAYWLASQTQAIDAHPAAEVGSIGVYTVLDDFSAMYEEAGVKTHVVSSHPLKGTGVEGAPITDAQLADVKRMIDGFAELFVGDVAAGRAGKMSREQVEKHATGQTWLGKEALSAGLVDSIRGDETASMQTNVPVMGAQPAAVAAAAIAAEVTTMTPEEIAKLQADNEAKTREIDALKTAQRKTVLDKHAGKIAPAQRASVEQMANALGDAEKLDAILATWPTLTRSERVSDAGPATVTEPDVDPEDAQFVAAVAKPLIGKAKVAKIMGMSVEDVEFYSHVKGFTHENGGQFIFEDGQTRHTLKRDELQALHAEVKQARTTGPLAARIAGGLRKIGVVMGIVLALFAGVDAQATALSAARATECKSGGTTKSYLMLASETIYAGSLVMINSAGTAESAAASASNNGVVGVSQTTKTSAASGEYWIGVTTDVICKFVGTSLAQTAVGELMYAADDQTVDETAGANQPIAGLLVQYVSATSGWVLISPYLTPQVASTADPLTLTGDLTLSGGAGAATFTDSASSIVVPNNDATALLIGGSDQLNLLTIDSGTNTETVIINGTTAVESFNVAIGTSTFTETATLTAGAIVSDNGTGCFGSSSDACFEYDGDQGPDSFVLWVSADSNAIIMAQKADQGVDFTHADATNPTLFIQSADSTTVADYLGLYHNQTDGHITTGSGDLHLEPTGADVIVTGTLTSSTGLISQALEANLTAGACTAGTWKVDNNATRELCRCNDAGTAYDCISVTQANGPTD